MATMQYQSINYLLSTYIILLQWRYKTASVSPPWKYFCKNLLQKKCRRCESSRKVSINRKVAHRNLICRQRQPDIRIADDAAYASYFLATRGNVEYLKILIKKVYLPPCFQYRLTRAQRSMEEEKQGRWIVVSVFNASAMKIRAFLQLSCTKRMK